MKSLTDSWSDEQTSKIKKNEEALKALTAAMNAYTESFSSDFFGEAGLSTWFDIMHGKIEGFGDDWAVTTLAITEAFQEMVNFMSSASENRFNQENDQNERQYNLATEFAGDSATAKAEIDKQYEAKKRAIANREAKAKKQLAIFNIVVDTAQAAISEYAKNGYVGALLALAIGAVELVMVNNQQVPQYWKGTDNAPQGWAQVDERGAEIHTDKHGNIKSTGSTKGANLRYLEAGDKIITAEKSKAMMFNNELNGLLSQNGISQPIIINNDSAMNEAQVGRIVNAVQSLDFGLSFDENGLKKWNRAGANRERNMNSRMNHKGTTNA
jgi:hypothetical protein